ncbi:hypothetical protein DPMN_153062 [Dreissena polymorpha]|uniref:Uncharacterized protein n=1 Tax=Dreissena polymorpha TaxID=45954 RepID=A0A9D4FKS6_DREPO|nr:hypothetical protein DPMN_153062 [Dreissena polymorpha]
MSVTLETPDRTRNSKPALSWPDNELNSEHKHVYQSIMESPLASQSCEPTISFSEEAIQKIPNTLVATTFRAHIETIVENVVTSIISKITSKLELLEDENTKLCSENSELKAKLNLLEIKLDDQEHIPDRIKFEFQGLKKTERKTLMTLFLTYPEKLDLI